MADATSGALESFSMRYVPNPDRSFTRTDRVVPLWSDSVYTLRSGGNKSCYRSKFDRLTMENICSR